MDLKQIKIDQETLIKHRFWIALGVLVPLVLIALVILNTTVQGAIKRQQDTINQTKQSLNGIKNNPNPKWEVELTPREKEAVRKRGQIWGAAWKTQEPLLIYPQSLQAELSTKYFGDDINENSFDVFRQDDGYVTQLDGVWRLVDPVLPNGRGAVQYEGGPEGYKSVLKQIHWDKHWETRPDKEEVWLSEENLWVYRGLLMIIKDTNDSAAVFHSKDKEDLARLEQERVGLQAELTKLQQQHKKKPAAKEDEPEVPGVGGEAENPEQKVAALTKKLAAVQAQQKAILDRVKIDQSKGEIDKGTFVSNDWKLELMLVKGPPQTPFILRGRLTNVSPRKLAVTNLKFLVQLSSGPAPEEVMADGEPLAPGQSLDLAPTAAKAPTPQRIEAVVQAFDWRSVPVKRIDMLLFGPEAKLAPKEPAGKLVAWPGFAPPKPENSEDSSAGAGGGGGGMGGGDMMSSAMNKAMSQMGSMGGGGGGSATPNGFIRDRYLTKPAPPNEAVRRIPVNMVLVIDQNYLEDLQAAIANSRLRLQADMVEWRRFRGDVMPSSAVKQVEREKKDEKATGAGGGAASGAGTKTDAANANEGKLANLIRVAVYGRASLYGRYPPKQAPAAGTDTAAAK